MLGVHAGTGEQVAIKMLSKGARLTADMAERMLTEISCLMDLEHPHIIQLRKVINEPQFVALVLQYAPGGDLHRMLVQSPGYRLPEELAGRIFMQIVKAVQCAHNRGIAHRDVKLENILLRDEGASHCYLTDFGLSELERVDEASTRPCRGSLYYLAPELVTGSPHTGQSIDVWCLGIILFAMLAGRLPFRSASVVAAAQRARGDAGAAAEPTPAWKAWTSDESYDPLTCFSNEALRRIPAATVIREVKASICAANPEWPSDVSEGALSLLRQILSPNALDRPKPSRILAHPWMQACRSAGLASFLPKVNPSARASQLHGEVHRLARPSSAALPARVPLSAMAAASARGDAAATVSSIPGTRKHRGDSVTFGAGSMVRDGADGDAASRPLIRPDAGTGTDEAALPPARGRTQRRFTTASVAVVQEALSDRARKPAGQGQENGLFAAPGARPRSSRRPAPTSAGPAREVQLDSKHSWSPYNNAEPNVESARSVVPSTSPTTGTESGLPQTPRGPPSELVGMDAFPPRVHTLNLSIPTGRQGAEVPASPSTVARTPGVTAQGSPILQTLPYRSGTGSIPVLAPALSSPCRIPAAPLVVVSSSAPFTLAPLTRSPSRGAWHRPVTPASALGWGFRPDTPSEAKPAPNSNVPRDMTATTAKP